MINWLSKKQLQSYIFLKKPVNNLEIGYIKKINVEIQNIYKKPTRAKSNNEGVMIVKNIFEKEIKIPYNKLESINFEYNSALIQVKSSTSFSSRLGYKILKKFKPKRVIMT